MAVRVRHRPVISGLLVGAISVLLAACAVGPDYERPHVAVDEFVTPDTLRIDTANVEREFWKMFDDGLLTELIEDSLRANHDVRIALSRLSEARALRGHASEHA